MCRLVGTQRCHPEDACRVKLEVDEIVEFRSLDLCLSLLHGDDLDFRCGLGRNIVRVDASEGEDIPVPVFDCDGCVVG